MSKQDQASKKSSQKRTSPDVAELLHMLTALETRVVAPKASSTR